ncbi:hypothetical protein SAMN05877962_11767 [Alloalcanivorax xenomutans]|uniref:hypothetical protein n=1 Tax=Alloalcanivorax xenomutans TaxID=1094342 RepID=UPI000BCA5FAD|nr:hypothetical protein [Alloalcanivorax xenomutans]SOC20945.1 hypothetical protein SAMN05877962_11767 [Alloalcanivorax xenomutans]
MRTQRLYQWLCERLQRQDGGKDWPQSSLDHQRVLLQPCDVLLVDSESALDRRLRRLTGSRFSRALLYIGRLHDVADPSLRALLADYVPCEPDTQLVLDASLERGLRVRELSTLSGLHLRVCRAQNLSTDERQDALRYAISRVGTGSTTSWSTLMLLWLFPWRTLPSGWRRRLANRLATELLRTLSGSLVGEAFAFIQFPVYPLVKRPEDDGSRLLRLQPRLFHAADFDHSPYFDVIKAPYLLDQVPAGFQAIPWKGNAGAMASEQRASHLSLVDTP